MKISEAVKLANPELSPRWERARQWLDKLPSDELKFTAELAAAINCSAGGLLDDGLPQVLADYSTFIRCASGGKRRVFGNPKAIKELRKQLETL